MTSTAAPGEIVSGGPRPPRSTLNALFFDAVERYDKPDALQVKVDGTYQPISHRTLADRVRRAAMGLRALGIASGSRVAILSENRPEWAIADFACLTACLTDVPVYPSLPPEQIAFVLRDSGAVAIFVSTREQAAKIAAVRGELPELRSVIGFDPATAQEVDLTLAALEAEGATHETPESIGRYRADALAVSPDDVATIIYTSGTTGDPKGAMLTHDNIASNVQASLAAMPLEGGDVALSFLPLSHVFERTPGHFGMFAAGASIAYAESIDTVAQNMIEVRPTIVLSVPRLYEKMYARVLENARAGGAVKWRIFGWARAVADRWATVKLAGRTPRGLLAAQYALAQKLVFSKLKQRTGGRLRYFVSGGAPLAPDINKFFYAAGLTILEGYGLTESSPVIAVNRPVRLRIGTVGPPVAGVEVTIALDGEILARGPNIMKGYFHNPEATREAIDADGWLHTGDIGALEDGFLRITDRKKDIIVTAGGKNIAPQPIETRIKTSKFVSQAVMLGDRRRFPLVLVVPNFEQLEKWARYKQLAWVDRRALMAHPAVQSKMEREVQRKLEGFARFETPKKVVLLEHDFSIESGELTPTLKVKRRVIERRYAPIIESAYAEEPAHEGSGAEGHAAPR
ncbi:MAG TPA: long-chain fatty acid--CoA ligase [Gemmatimonadaceae bacterium]|nr:long-chain fatty acid--CoA ligase [Gemmatimonadaceae bacterium]